MIKIKTFVFNPFRVNTILLYDETNECIIVDAGCYDNSERKQITDFIKTNGLKIIKLLITHSHIDHILGITYMLNIFPLATFEADEKSILFIKDASVHASAFGLSVDTVPEPSVFLSEKDVVHFGKSVLTVISTPGHADGSLCFFNAEQKFVITGDVLFKGSIGRTDLPTGNYDLIMQSIRNKLMTMNNDVIVLCGHGAETTIGEEKKFNPFL